MEANITLPQTTVSRLLNDIRTMYKSPLHNHGIYYTHDEQNILKGYALIVGGEDTPYYGGYYFFEFHYPPNYPFAPPHVVYCTNQNDIRFNPNLYTNGKVCVSILNTWAGEQWTSCQTLTTVLLSLSTLLCKDPFLNEPSITVERDGERIATYNKMIEYVNIDIAVCNILMKHSAIYMPFFDLFYPTVVEHWHKNKERFYAFCRQKMASTKAESIDGCYSKPRQILIDYESLLAKLQHIDAFIEKGEAKKKSNINDTP